MTNCVEFPILYHALTVLGAILSPAAPTSTATELGQQLIACNASFVVTHRTVASAKEAAATLGIASDHCSSVGSSTMQSFSVLQDLDNIHIPQVSIDLVNDVNYLPFSRGTTGLPKGVKLSFWNLVVNIQQLASMETYSSPLVMVLPYYHMYGALLMKNTPLICQPQIVLPKFDLATF
ncbi:Aste57867_10963 [Aphanomyces stellatus]|uniref:Aste57867_10963 protein n=1 Tax=Aphanomyces stellatus TaxID=120398 RepID=A0A485KSE7_9STRA|nr:hypothetical protein As57867_010923 [Aphanomyces stellatus]VFT87831.1 Aste57867_10963 [Aphanomyces stellatus]